MSLFNKTVNNKMSDCLISKMILYLLQNVHIFTIKTFMPNFNKRFIYQISQNLY